MTDSVENIQNEIMKKLQNQFQNDDSKKIIYLQKGLNDNVPEIKNNPNVKQATINVIDIFKKQIIEKFIDDLNKEYINDTTNEKKINRINEEYNNTENISDPLVKTIVKELLNNTLDKLKKSGSTVSPAVLPTVSPAVSSIVPKPMSVEEYETQITNILNQTFPNPNDNYRKISYIQDNSIDMIERAGLDGIESKKKYNTALNNISKKLKSQIVDANVEYLNKKYQNDPTNIEKIKDLMDIKESFINNTNIEGFESGTDTVLEIIKADTLNMLLSNKNYHSNSYVDYSIHVKTLDDALEFHKSLDSSLNNLFSYLKTQNVNPDVLYEKVNYREIEHEKIFNINNALDILYYSFYFSFLLIMICMGNVKREHFLIYLFVGLIPIIYPFLFKFGKIFIEYLSPPLHGPKNAFVDSHNTIYAYNI